MGHLPVGYIVNVNTPFRQKNEQNAIFEGFSLCHVVDIEKNQPQHVEYANVDLFTIPLKHMVRCKFLFAKTE